MGASDLIKSLQQMLARRGPSTYAPRVNQSLPRCVLTGAQSLRCPLYDQDLVLTVVLRHDIVLGTVPPHDFADVTVQDFMAASFLPLNVSVSQVDDQAIKPGS